MYYREEGVVRGTTTFSIGSLISIWLRGLSSRRQQHLHKNLVLVSDRDVLQVLWLCKETLSPSLASSFPMSVVVASLAVGSKEARPNERRTEEPTTRRRFSNNERTGCWKEGRTKLGTAASLLACLLPSEAERRTLKYLPKAL